MGAPVSLHRAPRRVVGVGVLLGVGLAIASTGAGAVPRMTTLPAPAGQNRGPDSLYAPACASATACFVLGWSTHRVTTRLDRFDGRRLVADGPPLPDQGNGVLTMSCPTTSFCMAVGLTRPHHGRAVPSAEAWDGRTWRTIPVPVGPASSASPSSSDVELRSVSCTSADMCVAVGTSYNRATAGDDVGEIRRWNGARWSIEQPAVTRGDFSSVSCGSPRFCVVAGTGRNAFPTPEIDRGDGWKPVGLPVVPGGGRQGLAAVSCPAADRCVGVGSAAVTVRLHGRPTATRTALVAEDRAGHWTTQRLPLAPGVTGATGPGADGLGAISCAPGATLACTARGGSASPTAPLGTVNSLYAGRDLVTLGTDGWTQSESPVLLHGLACASPTLCVAPAVAAGRLELLHDRPSSSAGRPSRRLRDGPPRLTFG